MIKVACSQCGAVVERDPAKLKRNDNFFCGRPCYDAWRKTHMRGANNPNWSEPVHTNCATCGKAIERNPSRVGITDRKVHFCSKPCKYHWLGKLHEGWRGGQFRYCGPNWRSQKRLARQRDQYHCRICGISQSENGRLLDVHHIVPFKEYNYIPGENETYLQANDLSNLITLCRGCHKKAEKGKVQIPTDN